MKILVLNAGSSSLKYQLMDMDGEKVLAKGNCERIGIDGKFTHKTADGRVIKKISPCPTIRRRSILSKTLFCRARER